MIPGVGGFTLNTPIFERVTMHLKHGDLTITGGSETKIYTTGLKVNGRAHDRAWIDWKELSDGATLEFTTSAKPAGRWGQMCIRDSYKLNVYFPVALDAPELYKDAPFDVCKSRLKDTRFSTWDNIKHDILLHWADLAECDGGYGLALLTDHTTSYIYGGGSPLGLTVQYSGGGL